MSFFDELRHRRVPQTLVGYVLGLWGGAQVIDFVEQRYGLSPYWVELFVLGYLILLPAVIAVAWNKGAPERQKWSRVGATAVILNIVVAVVVLSIGASVRDLRAVTRTVVFENEEGETIEREVPREAFRRSVTMSFPIASTLDAEAEAHAVDVAFLLENGLAQTPFLSQRSAWFENARAVRAGLDDARSMPRALVHEAARAYGTDAFLVGTVVSVETGFRYEYQLLRTADGTPIAARAFESTDVFVIADEVAAWVRETLEIPEGNAENRPVTDLTTESPEALRALTAGVSALHFDSDFARATEHFQNAVDLDPSFAVAHLALYQATVMNGRMDIAIPAIDEAMKHSYRLNERTEFLVRASYYGARNDSAKTMAVLEMWATVHPDDPAAWQMLATNYSIVRDVDKTVQAIEALRELRPDDIGSLQLGIESATRVGMHDLAIEIAEHWAELTPNETAPLVRMSGIQIKVGRLDDAAATIERTLLLDPTSIATRQAAASVDRRRGRFDDARRVYEDLLASDGPDADRVGALNELFILDRRLGRIDAALEHFEAWQELGARMMPAAQFQLRTSTMLDVFVDDRRPEVARARLAELRATATEPAASLLSMGGVELALALWDAESASRELEALSRSAREWNVGVLFPQIEFYRVRERLVAEDYEGALAASDSLLSLDQTAHHVGQHRARAFWKLGRLDEALEAVDWQLATDRAQPWALRTRARILVDLGRRSEAVEAYEAALAVWKDADPDFEDAEITRRELEELRRES